MSLHHLSDKEYETAFDNYQAERIVFGEGGLAQLCAELMLTSCSCLAVITGGRHTTHDSGVEPEFNVIASSFDIDTPSIRDIPAEPTTDDVRRIVAELENIKPDQVLAIGGGSVMDAAKAAWLSWQSGLDVKELFGVNQSAKKCPGKKFKRIICVPTTAGTGSEATPYSNIVEPEQNVKCLIMDDQIVPEICFVDYRYTMSLPSELTITCGVDALVHSIESLLNTKAVHADPDAEKWALEAVQLIHYALPRVIADPQDALAREMMAAAATLGGMCIRNRPTSLPHLCSYSLYGKVPHGMAVGAFLIPFWRYCLTDKAVQEQTMKLAGIFYSEEPQRTPEAVVDACAEFLAAHAGINGLAQFGIDQPVIAKIAEDALRNPVKLESAPRRVPADRAKKIITEILTSALN